MTPFLKFWNDLNALLTAHKLPEMLYGDARELWNQRYEAWTTDATGLIDTNKDTGEMRA